MIIEHNKQVYMGFKSPVSGDHSRVWCSLFEYAGLSNDPYDTGTAIVIKGSRAKPMELRVSDHADSVRKIVEQARKRQAEIDKESESV